MCAHTVWTHTHTHTEPNLILFCWCKEKGKCLNCMFVAAQRNSFGMARCARNCQRHCGHHIRFTCELWIFQRLFHFNSQPQSQTQVFFSYIFEHAADVWNEKKNALNNSHTGYLNGFYSTLSLYHPPSPISPSAESEKVVSRLHINEWIDMGRARDNFESIWKFYVPFAIASSNALQMFSIGNSLMSERLCAMAAEMIELFRINSHIIIGIDKIVCVIRGLQRAYESLHLHVALTRSKMPEIKILNWTLV